MLKKILLYGLVLAAGVLILRFAQYKYLLLEYSFEIYGGIIALIFAGVGIWAGNKLTRRKEKIIEVEKKIIVKEEVVVEKEIVREVIIDKNAPFTVNQSELESLGISKREYEVLQLMADGLSNQEIADKLFISLSTVKTHSSNLFQKLGAERRTQAIQNAKSAGLIP